MANRTAGIVLRHLHRLAATPFARHTTDDELLDRFVRRREEAAFAALVERHGPMVLRVCRRVLQDRHAAEDAFQATFLVLVRKAGAIGRRELLANWLYGVAYRIAMRAKTDAAKRENREARAAARTPGSPVSEAVAWELCTVLDEELNRLPDKYRAPLLLCYLEGQTRDEAAKQLHWSLGTLKRRLEQGRERLRRRLTRRGITFSAALASAALCPLATSAVVPAGLAHLTLQAAQMTATGKAAGSIVSANVAALTDATLKSFSLMKLKLAAVLIVGLCVLGAGAGVVAQRAVKPKEPEAQRAQEPKAVARAPEGAKKEQPKPELNQPRTDRYGDPLPEGALARLGTMRFRHGNGSTLAFAPDGKSLLTCGGDRGIRRWDFATGRLLREQKLPPELGLMATVLSPDGRLLAFQDFYSREVLYLWDVARNQLRHKLPVGESSYHLSIFTPDSKALVIGQYSGVLTAWDVETGQSRLLGKHKREFLSLAFTADGTLMTMTWEPVIRFWDLKTDREKAHTTIPEDIVGAAVSPDGQTVAIWTFHNEDKDKGLRFWDVASGRPAKGWIAPDQKRIRGATFAPDGKTVLFGTDAGILVWDPIAGKKLRLLRGGIGRNFMWSPDGKTLADFGTGSLDHHQGTMVHLWDVTTGAPHPANVAERGHQGEVVGVAFSLDSRLVASSCSRDKTVRFWEAANGRPTHSLSLDQETSHNKLAFSEDGKHLFVGISPAIIRYEVSSGREVGRYPLFEAGKEDRRHLMVMHLTDDGRTLLAVSSVGNGFGLHAWNVTTGKRLRYETLSVDAWLWVGYSHFSADGRWLAFPGSSIRDAATGKEILHLSVEGKFWGAPVAFSRDGAFIAAGVWQKVTRPNLFGTEMVAVQVWELATLLPVVRLETGELADLTFTPDGRRLVTAGPDALKLWDLATAKAVSRRDAPGRFRGSFGASFASSFALAADGHTVATGQPDTAILLWDLRAPPPDQSTKPLSNAQLEKCWSDLAAADAGRALVSSSRLGEAPAQAVALLRNRLHPAQSPTPEELRRLIADLDDAQFGRREAATKQLSELGELADAALREALRRQPSLEMRRRIEALLAEPRLVKTPEARRHLRAVRFLEQIGTAEVQQILKSLAKGAPEARLTQEAKAALARLTKSTATKP